MHDAPITTPSQLPPQRSIQYNMEAARGPTSSPCRPEAVRRLWGGARGDRPRRQVSVAEISRCPTPLPSRASVRITIIKAVDMIVLSGHLFRQTPTYIAA
jgi:hypothetical protein